MCEPKCNQIRRSNSQHKVPRVIFALNQSRSDFNKYKQFSSSLLRLRSWDFASMLGLGNVNETWDRM